MLGILYNPCPCTEPQTEEEGLFSEEFEEEFE